MDYIDYGNKHLWRTTLSIQISVYNYGGSAVPYLFNENVIFYQASHFCSIMSKQPIELWLASIELVSKDIIALSNSE